MHPIERISRCLERIYHRGLTTTSGGNISLWAPDGSCWITPTQVDKGRIGPEDIVFVSPDGKADGAHPPSSEHPFHRAIIAARPEFQAVLHVHLPAFSAFCIADRVPDTRILPQAHAICGTVGRARYALPGSQELASSIAAVFAAGHDCVQMDNHGLVIGGRDLDEAFARVETLEYCCRLLLRCETLGGARSLSAEQFAQLGQRRQLPCTATARPADRREQLLRREICTFVHRAYHHGLFISTEGTISCQLDEHRFLITPSGRDRHDLTPEDLVLVTDGVAPVASQPSRAGVLHVAIYARHPRVGAIFNAMPIHASCFAACGAPLDTRIIPESYVVLRDPARIPFGEQLDDGRAFAERFAGETACGLIENDGVISIGPSLLAAFDRLEVLDHTAQAVLAARALGGPQALPASAIEELRRAFC